jgi:hypothetical protein
MSCPPYHSYVYYQFRERRRMVLYDMLKLLQIFNVRQKNNVRVDMSTYYDLPQLSIYDIIDSMTSASYHRDCLPHEYEGQNGMESNR